MDALHLTGLGPTALAAAISLVLATVAFWLYRRQLRHSDLGRTGWLLPTLRGLAVAIIALTLAEPAIQLRTSDGDLARVTFLLDASQSMSVAPEDFADASSPLAASNYRGNRFDRGLALLTGPDGILSALENEFELSVIRFDQQAGVEIWNNRTGPAADDQELGFDWSPAVWGVGTAIGDALNSVAAAAGAISSAAHESSSASPLSSAGALTITSSSAIEQGDAVVLFSDGLNNQGRDPIHVAEQLQVRGLTVFSVGFGPFDQLSDLGLQQLTIPERLYRTDTLSGTVTVSQHLAQGTPFQLQLMHQGQIVWQDDLMATAELQRELPFSFPVAPLFNQAVAKLPAGTEVANLPIKLSARLSLATAEANQRNNMLDGYTLVASQKSRLLLLDGRSRWETRYLKNMFTRDPSWQLDSVIMSHAPSAAQTNRPTGQQSDAKATPIKANSLPSTRAELFEFDLVVLGEVEAFLLPADFLQWLREYVEVAGGGLIVIDGAREHLRDLRFEKLHGMLPIRWMETASSPVLSSRGTLTRSPQLTVQGQSLEALQLSPAGADTSTRMWAALPPLEFVAKSQPLPGAEVLLEAAHKVDRIPLLVTRQYGAGRVLYSASDETWRWRYELAERVHSRLWLQLARYTMKTPLSLHSEYVSLDTGAASYPVGQPVTVRSQLRTAGGQPASGLAATAVVTSGQRVVSTWPLSEEGIAGTYAAAITNLAPGDYQLHVAAPNFSTQALQLQSSFSIVAPPPPEMQRLACDEAELAAITSRTGGEYLRESQAVELIDLLQPLVRGKIRTSTWLLWQSYWWFSAAMLLLIAEWIIRKRVGLV